MGHTSIGTTLDLYGRLFPDANRSVLVQLDALTQGSSDHQGTMTELSEAESTSDPSEIPASSREFPDGACGIRTRDLRLAKPALSQLS
jgi:hypothetical protein